MSRNRRAGGLYIKKFIFKKKTEGYALMPQKIASRKRVILILAGIVIISAIICTILILSGKAPSNDPAELTAYIDKHESELIALAAQYPDQHKSLNNYFGLKSIDTRTDVVRYSFSWSYDIPEGGSFLYYARDGILENSGCSFTDSAYIDGLGIRGNGYIKCIKLRPNWFFIAYNIPT